MAETATRAQRERVLERLDDVVTKPNSALHVPAFDHDGEPVPYCGTGELEPTGWQTKSTAIFPGRHDRVCGGCASAWADAGHPTPSAATIPMTKRQREVLVAAIEYGYFEWPREHSGEDVAAKLGVTPATVNQYLRNALAGVVEHAQRGETLEAAGLTDRQREVFDTAVDMGFFEWPRDHSGEEVAAALDLAPATVNQHRRVALRKVLAVVDVGAGD